MAKPMSGKGFFIIHEPENAEPRSRIGSFSAQ